MSIEKKHKNLLISLALAGIILLAFSARVWNIDATPAGVYPDEAVNGMDAYKSLVGVQPYLWFYPDNNGREGLFMHLIAVSFSVFDVSVLGLKFPSIVFGTLTVLGTYLLTTELTRSRKAGLISAFLVATSFWAINFSRIAFRANMLPFVLVFSSYFLFLGLRIRKLWPFLLGGLIFGLGLHTYIAFRIAPAILITLFFVAWLSRPRFLQNYWKHILLFLAGSVITASPMLWTFSTHPEFLESRSASISVFSPEINGGHPWMTLGKSVLFTVQQYNLVGDMNWRHNYPPYPILNPIVGIAFLIGLIMTLRQFFILLWQRIARKKRNRKLEVSAFLLAWLVLMHAPSFLTFEGIPHALRSIGALPAVYIIATLPFAWLVNRYSRENSWCRSGAVLFVFTLLATTGIFNLVKYHVFWAQEPQQYASFNSNLIDIVEHIRALPQDTPVYVITGPMERIVIALFTTDLKRPVIAVYPDQISSWNFPENAHILLPDRDANAIRTVNETFGPVIEKEMLSPPGKSFYILKK